MTESSAKRAPPVTVGIWQQLPLPAISRFLGLMGWDWVVLDMQHGQTSFETAYECVHVVRQSGATPVVRVAIGVPSEVQRALDIGAQAVVVPMVNSVSEARAVALAAKYPPLGCRSVGGDPAFHLGDDYVERANRETRLLVQVEHIDSVRVVDEIMALEGVDGCFVGPTDLALSMGLPRLAYDQEPEHQRAMARIVAACQRNAKLACCNTYSLADFRDKLERGWRVLTLRSELDLFHSAGTALLSELRQTVTAAGSPAS